MTTFNTGHIGLNVTDIQQSKQFYQDVFGFNVIGESVAGEKKFVFLAERETLILTLWQQSNGRFPTNNPGLHHLAFAVDSVSDIEVVERKLQARGAKIYHNGIVTHREGASSGGLFFEDPDGIRLEVSTATGVENHPAPNGEAPTCGFF